MRVDAHQHFWSIARGDYGWLTPEFGPIYRDFLPEDLVPDLQATGIDGTVVVQAAPTVDETEFLLQLASGHDFIQGVVGWLDFESPDFERGMRGWQNAAVVGLRPMIQDLPEEDWMLRPRVVKHMRLAAERDLAIDFLVLPRHLPYLARLLEAVPELRGVVDHLAKPPIRDGGWEPWATDLARIARHPGIMCKLSGLVTEAEQGAWTPDDLKPYVDHAVALFGPERLIFGSDWPVCLLAAAYREVYGALRSCLGTLLDDPKLEADVFGANAIKLYGLKGD